MHTEKEKHSMPPGSQRIGTISTTLVESHPRNICAKWILNYFKRSFNFSPTKYYTCKGKKPDPYLTAMFFNGSISFFQTWQRATQGTFVPNYFLNLANAFRQGDFLKLLITIHIQGKHAAHPSYEVRLMFCDKADNVAKGFTIAQNFFFEKQTS